MYKSHTSKDFKKYFGLPEDYKIDGVLSYGTWRKNEHKELLKEILIESGHRVEYEHLGESFLRDVLVFKIKGKRFWFEVGYGGAYISEIFHFGCMLGSRKNIMLGTCGGLLETGKTGDIILPTYSHGNESTTRMYKPNSKNNKHFSDRKLNKSLKRRLNNNLMVHEGPVITCQAMLSESWEDVLEWSREGYLGVEMETSTVFAVSKHFNVPASGVLVVADNLIKKETTLHGNYEKAKEARNKIRDLIYKIALEELLED